MTVDDDGFKPMVSVPCCTWANEVTSLGRTQVRAHSISVLLMAFA